MPAFAGKTAWAARANVLLSGMNAPTRLPSGPSATPARARFVHLKVHSAYSLLEGALPIGKLAKLAASSTSRRWG